MANDALRIRHTKTAALRREITNCNKALQFAATKCVGGMSGLVAECIQSKLTLIRAELKKRANASSE